MSVLILWPVAGYYLTGVLEPIFPTYSPFFDENTTFGYAFYYLYDLSACVLALSGTCGSDFTLFILVIHMWPMAEIFGNMFKQLNEGLMVENNRNSSEMRDHFRNILMVHRDMCWFVFYQLSIINNFLINKSYRYLEGISGIYYYMIFVEVFTCAQCLCSILFCLTKVEHL